MNDDKEPGLGYVEALGEAATNPSNPRTTGEELFALGQWWRVASCELRIRAQFEGWVRRGAKKAISDAEMEDGPEEAGAMRSAYQAALGAGHYSWDGRYCRSARGDLPGIRYLLYLLIRRCHPDVTESQVEAMFSENPRGCGMALRWALGNMGEETNTTKSNGEGNRGNVQAPAVREIKSGDMTDEEREVIRRMRQEKRNQTVQKKLTEGTQNALKTPITMEGP
jgi:hypothetical protein